MSLKIPVFGADAVVTCNSANNTRKSCQSTLREQNTTLYLTHTLCQFLLAVTISGEARCQASDLISSSSESED